MIGINTAVAGVGLGLAVPINAATRDIVGALMRDGRAPSRDLGIARAVRDRCPPTRAAGSVAPAGSRSWRWPPIAQPSEPAYAPRT